MTTAASERSPLLWAESWAVQVAVEADSLEHRMEVALASAPVDDQRSQVADAIRELIAEARAATRRKSAWRFRGPFDRWRGTSIDRAYRSLHAARVFLIELLPDGDVDALTSTVAARAATCLARGDPRQAEIQGLGELPSGPVKRAKLRQAEEVTYDASDQLHVRVRVFRNILFAAGLLILGLMVALVWIVSTYPKAMPLCFTPAATAATAGAATGGDQLEGATTFCPSGDRQAPSSGDVVIVSGLGLLGGSLAAAFAIRKVRGSATPYDVPIALAVLKVPSGALTAVVGILLLGGGFVPGFSELDSQRQILAYALLFGYAQQLGTRFIDDRAKAIVNSVPSKDAEGKQPQPAVGGTTSRPAEPGADPAS
jgi:hypothetical protein